MAKTLEELKDEIRICKYCGGKLLASTNQDVSHFGVYEKKNKGYYYQTNCKECQREVVKLKKYNSIEQMKEKLREKRAFERANRRRSIYRIAINTDFMLDRIREKYTIWHNNIYYVGITKQEAKHRWYEHLYDLRTNTHSNRLMQDKYNKIRELYSELDDKEFQVLFETEIVKFEVITTLDKYTSKEDAHLYEKFEIKALENQLKRDVKDEYLQAVRDDKSIEKLIYTQDDVILNLEHCKSSINYLKEIDKKITLGVGSTRVIS